VGQTRKRKKKDDSNQKDPVDQEKPPKVSSMEKLNAFSMPWRNSQNLPIQKTFSFQTQ
jgi:hypothetical protein